MVEQEEFITEPEEKPKGKSAEPEEKPKAKKTTEVKRKSIGEKKPKKVDEPIVIESIDEPDNVKVDNNIIEDDLKPTSKPSSRRGSKKEKSPEKTTPSIEVYAGYIVRIT